MTIRLATAQDADALARLAVLDSHRLPDGPFVVAQVAGELWAAVSHDGAVIADPFRPTADLVSLLAVRAGQLGLTEPTRSRLHGLGVVAPRRRPRLLVRTVGETPV